MIDELKWSGGERGNMPNRDTILAFTSRVWWKSRTPPLLDSKPSTLWIEVYLLLLYETLIPSFQGTRKFITVFTRVRHSTTHWTRRIMPTFYYFLRFILKLFFYLLIGLPSDFFPPSFQPKASSSLHSAMHPPSILSSLICVRVYTHLGLSCGMCHCGVR